jgi:hypothetical protein
MRGLGRIDRISGIDPVSECHVAEDPLVISAKYDVGGCKPEQSKSRRECSSVCSVLLWTLGAILKLVVSLKSTMISLNFLSLPDLGKGEL